MRFHRPAARLSVARHRAGASVTGLYRCQACGAALLVRVRFKGELVWTIDESDPDFSGSFPEPRGPFGSAKLSCSADPLHDTGFHLVDGAVERNPASQAWE